MSNTLEARIIADAAGFAATFDQMAAKATSTTSKITQEFVKASSAVDKVSASTAKLNDMMTKAQALANKAFKAGVQPKFKEMSDFLTKEGVSLYGTQKLLSEFSKQLSKAHKDFAAEAIKLNSAVSASAQKVGGSLNIVKAGIVGLAQTAALKVPVIGGALAGVAGGGGGGGGGILDSIMSGGGNFLKTIGLITIGITALGGAIALVAGKKLGELANESALATKRLQEMSDVIGISLPRMSQLEHAAIMEQESLQTLQGTFSNLNSKMQEAASGNRAVQFEFEQFGIKVINQLTGKVRPLLDIIFELSDSIKDMSGSERLGKLTDLMSRADAAKFIKMFSGGSEAIKKTMSDTERFGLVMDDVSSKMSGEYLKAVSELSERWRGLRKGIGEDWTPFFTSLYGWLATTLDAATGLWNKLNDIAKTRHNQIFGSPEKSGVAGSQLGGQLSLLNIMKPEEESKIKSNFAQMEKWKNLVDDARRSLEGQVTSLTEQAISMTKGELAAKGYALGQAKIEAIERARKDGAPAKVIAQLTAVYNALNATILVTVDRNMKLKYAMDQLAERARQIHQDEQDARQSGDDAAKAQIDMSARLLDVFNRTDVLTKGVVNLSDSYKGLVSHIDPGTLALQSFTKSIDDQEKSIRSLIATAEKEAIGFELSTEAKAAIEQLKALLVRIQEAQRNPQGALSGRVAGEMAATHRDSMLAMMLEAEALKASTKEQRLNLLINREIIEWKKKGVDLTIAENAGLLDQVGALAQIRVATEDALQRQKDAIETVQKALESAVENMQSSFADMWYNIFDPESGEDFGKRFLKSVLQGWLRALSQVGGVMMTGLMESLMQQTTGMSMKELTAKMSTGIVGFLGMGRSAPIPATKENAPFTFGNEWLDMEAGAERAGKTLIAGASSSADTFIGKLMSNIPTFTTSLGTGMLTAVQNFGNWLLRLVDQAVRALSSMDFGGDSGGGGIGGWFAGLFGDDGSGGDMGVGTLVSGMGYARGGITPGFGHHGVIREPVTMARMGENAPREFEAVVPLPDNRSIPVTFTGRGGRGGQNNQSTIQVNPTPTVIEVHFHNPIDPASMKTSYSELVQTFRKDKKTGGPLTTIIKGVSK